jgi:prolyl-tRNA synthetase
VGHIFKLGLKYSKALKATYLDADGKEQYLYMGCYGIGVSRIVAAAIEQGHDANGIIFPMTLAPFQVGLIPIAVNDPAVWECVEKLHSELEAAGMEVLLDDRDERPGVKFKDCDLLGLPLRVVVGAKALAQGNAEVRHRRAPDNRMVPLPDLISYLQDQIAQEQHD